MAAAAWHFPNAELQAKIASGTSGGMATPKTAPAAA